MIWPIHGDLKRNGGQDRTRTCDQSRVKALLYQLSYLPPRSLYISALERQSRGLELTVRALDRIKV